ncbi:MAG: carbonic anhydrase [Deltaproteobacteria bacterium]|nr:carbonic anhydrase [Deltaproteobacteria bacterium]
MPNSRILKTRVHHLMAIAAIFCTLAFAAASADQAAPLVPPAKALQLLLEGNQRYVADHAGHPNQRPSDSPQHPLAVVLSCSDSRVPPEIIFDQGVGNLFIVRVAGNTYDRLALQSIEYAISHLGTTLIMVIGHDQCGAVTAAMKTYPDSGAGPMLVNIYPAVREARGQPDELSKAIDYNAVLMARKLEHEPELAEKVKGGQLKILPARYNLKTGAIKLLK